MKTFKGTPERELRKFPAYGKEVLYSDGGSDYVVISAATTTEVSKLQGRLCKLIVTGGSMGLVTIYDSLDASGTKVYENTPADNNPINIQAPIKNGITIVTATAIEIFVSFIEGFVD